MTDYLEVRVQLCKDCYLHTWCSRHDQNKYESYFQAFRVKILQKFPHASIIKNNPPPSYKKLLGKSNTGEGKYFDANNNKIAYFPRFGSFEVSVNSILIFSKLSSSMWPNIEYVCHSVQQIRHNISKGINPDILNVSSKLEKNRNLCNTSENKNKLFKRSSLQKYNTTQIQKPSKIINNKSLPNFNHYKICCKSKTINIKKISTKYSCYGIKFNNIQQENKSNITHLNHKNIHKIKQSHQSLEKKFIIPKKFQFPISKISQSIPLNNQQRMVLKNNEEQQKSINFDDKINTNKQQPKQQQNIIQNVNIFLHSENQSKNNLSLNGWSSKKSTPINGFSCLSISKLTEKQDQSLKCPSIDVRIIKQQKNAEDHIIETDGQNTNFSEQVSQQENSPIQIKQLKLKSKLMKPSSLLCPINKSEQTSFLIDEQTKSKKKSNPQQNQGQGQLIPFSYLMPTKMQQWSASASIDQSEIQTKLGKSETISSNGRTNILNKLQYASSFFKCQKPNESQLTIQNQPSNLQIKQNTTNFIQTNHQKTNHVFFQDIQKVNVQKENLSFYKDILGISKPHHSNPIQPPLEEHRDIQIQMPQFRFSKNTFISDVYSEQVQSSYMKCEQTDSQLFPYQAFKQIQSQINQDQQPQN